MSILVYTENWEGKFKKLSFELVSYASALAEMMNTSVTALSIGSAGTEEMRKLGTYGASKIINIADGGVGVFDTRVYTDIIADVALKEGATVLILSNNISGKALAPRLSVRLKAGLGSGVSRLPLSLDPFIVYKRAYSGNAYAHLIIRTDVRILTLAQNSFVMKENPTGAEPEVLKYEGAVKPMTEVAERSVQTGRMLLTDAGIVVSGGRGMKSAENWGPLEELASLLGAATACSRPVSDEGWRPHEEHTGQTGKIIAPDLYLAVGISGATQHLAGVSSSKYIVAINNDKDAPIFESAQYGIVGDALKVVPKLVEAVKALKK